MNLPVDLSQSILSFAGPFSIQEPTFKQSKFGAHSHPAAFSTITHFNKQSCF